MIKALGAFLILFVVLYFAIEVWAIASNKAKISVLKTLAYSSLISGMTVAILIMIVILF